MARSRGTCALGRGILTSWGYERMSLCFLTLSTAIISLATPRAPGSAPQAPGADVQCLSLSPRARVGQFGPLSRLPRSAEPTVRALGWPPETSRTCESLSSATKHKGAVVASKPAPQALPACPARCGANPGWSYGIPTQQGAAWSVGGWHSAPHIHLEQFLFLPLEPQTLPSDQRFSSCGPRPL